MENKIRYAANTSPVISITKWHDLQEQKMFYDLYLNGKIDSRYSLEGLMSRIKEVLFEV